MMKTFPLGFVMKKKDNEIQYKGVLDISGGATLCHRGLPTPTIFEKINGKLLYLSL